MNLSAGVSLGQLVLAFATALAASSVAWGGLLQRVKTLETQIKAMSGFAEGIGRIDERTLRMEQDIAGISAAWPREPKAYGATGRPRRRRL
jgi:hypothetical protein